MLHLLPSGVVRGAQTYVEELVRALDGDAYVHEILTMADPADRRRGLDVPALIRVRKEIRRRRPSLVVAHGGEPLKYAVLAASRRTPVVYYKIGLSGDALGAGWRLRLYRWLAGRAAATAAVSDELAEEARTLLRVPGERVVTILNGRDPAVFHPRPDAEPRASRPPTLLYVGHLNHAKRPMVLLDLVEHLESSGQPVAAMVAGDGPLLDDMRRRAAGLAVDVLGLSGEVPRLMRESDVLVFPSSGEFEGLPGVLIEAGLAGLPAVATDVPGVRTVIDDGVTGLVVPVGDDHALFAAVSNLARDPARRAAMGRRARERCAELFSMDASARAWTSLLESVLVNAASRSRQRPGLRR